MRVLHVTATYSPSINGVAISIKRLKKELENLGVDVFVLAPESQNKKQNEKSVIRYPSLPNPFFKDYPIPLIPNIKIVTKFLAEKKPDIVHVHHPFHVGFFSKLLAKHYRVPLVFTYHTRYDAYGDYYFKFLPTKLKKTFIQNSVNDFCKKTDLLISPLKSITDELFKRIPYINVVTIPSGLPMIPRENLSREAIREKLSIPKDKIVLLTVCRVSKEKNLSLLIKSITQLNSNFLLLIVGGGNYEMQLKELAYKEKVENRVRFIGLTEHEKLGIYYQAANIFVFPSITETQGLILLEALSFGLPIVAIDSEASREWISKEIGILTDNTPEDFTNGILRLEKRDKTKISKHAIDFAKQFSFSKVADRILSEYNRVMKQYNLGNKLLETGWQSWSPRSKSFLKIPAWNYAPKPDDFLPVNDEVIKKKKPATGWCSWYAFGFHISEQKILRQSEWFAKHKELPIEYILIDAGWTKNGDWAKSDDEKFPHGIKYTSKRIKSIGFKSGIWIAPYFVEPKSELFHTHPEWIAKGRLFYSDGLRGFPLGRIIFRRYILDVRKEEVRKYLFKCLDYLLLECGFELLKLDYLYSIYFITNISAREAGSILRNFFLEIRQRYPNIYTIACGSPLKPAISVVDSIRIGPDVVSPHLKGLPVIKNVFNSYKLNLVLQNVKKRSWTNEFWNLDPDVFVCCPSLGISDRKILELQQAVKNSQGNIFLGDDMTILPKSRIEKFIEPLFQ